MSMISFVVPCYGSELTLSAVVEGIHSAMLDRKISDYEIVLVSDASPDDVFNVITKLAKNDQRVQGAELSRNFGQHAALMAGYRMTSGDIVVSMDDDGQTPPEEIHKLLDAINQGYDVVYAQYPKTKQSMFRRFGSRVNALMLEALMGKPKGLQATSFFAMRRYVADEVTRYVNSYPYIIGLVLRTTNRIGVVEVNHQPRTIGTSNYSMRKLLSLWLNGATAFSVKPLRVATILGLFSATSGLVAVLAIIVHRIFNPGVPVGWSSNMAVLLFVGGIILLVLGIMGEYMGRMYITQNAAPQYVIRSTACKNRSVASESNEEGAD